MRLKAGLGIMSLCAAAFAGCGSAPAPAPAGVGSVNLNLQIPSGTSIDTLNLQIVCGGPGGVSQSHVLDVKRGPAVAAFGGLTPGPCKVTLKAQGTDGIKCAGSSEFTVVANATSEVAVTLLCQGINLSQNGNAKVRAQFTQHSCTADRIKKIYAIPSNVPLGESMVVQAEINANAAVGTPKYSWGLRNDTMQTARGQLAPASCSPTSSACQQFKCTDLGPSPKTDPRTGRAVASVYVTLKYEDDECFDTEEVQVDCLENAPRLDECNACIASLPDIHEFNVSVCQPNQLCRAALTCLQRNPSCWSNLAPAACYCGESQADIDRCESPTFIPTGPCAAELDAGGGRRASAELLSRYFDPAYPTGQATIIFDAAFQRCKACF